jgi:hypothetical protein
MNIKGIEIEKDDDMIFITSDRGEYDGFIEENGTVSFSVIYENKSFNEDNWKDLLKPSHAFVKIIDEIGGDVEAIDDYVMITVEVDKLLN